MLRFLGKYLRSPRFADDETNRIAAFLHIVILTSVSIALLVGLVDLISGVPRTMLAMLGLAFPLMIAYWLNRRGQVTIASYLMLLGTVAAVTVVLSVGQGIHDIGIIDLALILIISSYLLKRRGIVIVTLALIGAVAIVVFGEIYGLLPVKTGIEFFQPRAADFFIVALMIILGAVAISLLSSTLDSALEQTRKSEMRWRSLVDSAPDLIALIDPDGRIMALNQHSFNPVAFYLGKTVYEILLPADEERARQVLARVLGGEYVMEEFQLVETTGALQWYSASLGPLRQADGGITGILAIIRNIQTRKDAEAELSQGREVLRIQARQLETMYEITRAISGLQDLKGTLQQILSQIKAVLPLEAFVVALYDENTGLVSFPLVFDDGQLFDEPARRLPENSIILEAIRSRETRLINRSETELLDTPAAPHLRLGSRKTSTSILIAPMVMHNRVIGTVAVHSYQYNTYTSEHVAVLSGTAGQIAVAIENARLYETSRAKAEQLATLNEIGRSLATLRDLPGVFENAYQLLSHVLQMDGFYIAFYEAETGLVEYPFLIDSGMVMAETPRSLLPGSLIEQTLFHQPMILISRTPEEIAQRQKQLQEDDSQMIGNRTRVTASALMARLQFGDKTIGVISAQSYQPNAYTRDDLEILSGVANQLAIAIENSRLYSELQKELAERKRAEAEVRELNVDLEARVHQRTLELETTNRELAAFTYTVSHDLRAPIRGIHGLSHILLEEFGSQLAPAAFNYIERIQGNARQMGRLIDELLAFTHLGRLPVRKSRLELDKLAHQVIKNLASEEHRPVEFVIGALPPAYGDDSLIQQALTNLIGNALKFTAHTAQPRVELGSFQEGESTVYFVRDNGAGFEMAYAAKLFGVFERLHRQDEFEGTGVGLAIVKRIIDKHGGRIWAEGKVNQGATFYFTIPSKKE